MINHFSYTDASRTGNTEKADFKDFSVPSVLSVYNTKLHGKTQRAKKQDAACAPCSLVTDYFSLFTSHSPLILSLLLRGGFFIHAAKDHAARGGLQDFGDVDFHVFADVFLAVLDHDHCAVVHVANALSVFFAS